MPAGSTSYAQIVFDFEVPSGKQIVAVKSIQTNRPAASVIASFSYIDADQLEVWYYNVSGQQTSMSVTATVLVM